MKYEFASTTTRIPLTTQKVLKFSALSDFATNPTTSKLVVHCNDSYTVENRNGVTVKDVIRETIKYWDADTTFIDDGDDDYEEEGYGSERGYKQSRYAFSNMDDNCLWHKFDRAEINSFHNQATIHIITGFYY